MTGVQYGGVGGGCGGRCARRRSVSREEVLIMAWGGRSGEAAEKQRLSFGRERVVVEYGGGKEEKKIRRRRVSTLKGSRHVSLKVCKSRKEGVPVM